MFNQLINTLITVIMADAIISVLVEKVAAVLEELIPNEITLVRGVDEEVHKLSNELKTIRTVLDDAEKRAVKEESVKCWLKKLEYTAQEIGDVLDEWNYGILKLQVESPPKKKVSSFFPPLNLPLKKTAFHRDIAKKIQNVKTQLDEILEEKDRYSFVISQPTSDPSSEPQRVQSTSFIDLKDVLGREFDKNILLEKLQANGGSQEELGIQILSVVGGGGLGKTTLAQLVYNDKGVQECFELRIWMCVSDPFDEVGITKGIIEGVSKGSCPNINQLEMLLQHLRHCISGKKFLLVLDDVWTEDYSKWEPLKNSLKCGGAGSKILVTTRNQMVAKVMGTIDNDIYRLGQLSEEDCWLLLSRIALSERNENEVENFQDVGKKIAKKCKGLPLAAKALGSLLRFKNSLEEWENILDNEIWQLEKAEVELFPHLLLSYNELSPTLRRCFSYCAIFPKDRWISVKELTRHWMALGYLGSNFGGVGDMELKGWEYFQSLAMRSLFQDFEKDDLDTGQIKFCKMHDIVHDFAQFLRENGTVGAVGLKKTTCEACNPLLVSSANKFRSLLCSGDQGPPHLCDCLRSLRVLDVSKCNLHSIPQGMEKLIHLRWLDLSYSDLSEGDLKTICELYNLQTLYLVSCNLRKIPGEIGNLIHLRHLNLKYNSSLSALPDSICGLLELRTLSVEGCENLSPLPQEIHNLKNLKYIFNLYSSVKRFPQGLAQLNGLHGLSQFWGGSGWSNLGLLKNLNLLSGTLRLHITGDLKELVEDAREAELWRKTHIQSLELWLPPEMDEKESSATMDVTDALKPHPNLRKLEILFYTASKLPGWICSPDNHLRSLRLWSPNHLSSLPPLGKLPCLEEFELYEMHGLQSVGYEFLGITRRGDMAIESSSSSSPTAAPCTVTFPKLKKLTFQVCPSWKEWEDITAEEEEFAVLSIMPCLIELNIKECKHLNALPHRLLRKASSLETLGIRGSEQLRQECKDINPAIRVKE